MSKLHKVYIGVGSKPEAMMETLDRLTKHYLWRGDFTGYTRYRADGAWCSEGIIYQEQTVVYEIVAAESAVVSFAQWAKLAAKEKAVLVVSVEATSQEIDN